MKKLEEMTDKEITTLSESEIAVIVKEKIAEKGVKIMEAPEEPNVIDIPGADIELYTCSWLYNYAFKSKKDAMKFVELIKSAEMYYITTDYNIDPQRYKINRMITFEDLPKIVIEKVYSHQKYDEVKLKLAIDRKQREIYAQRNSEYLDAQRKSSEIAKEVTDYIKQRKQFCNRRTMLCSMFAKEYLPIAQMNEEVAINFMSKAYSMTDEEKKFVLSNYNN